MENNNEQKRINDLLVFTVIEKWIAEKIITDEANQEFLDYHRNSPKNMQEAAKEHTNYVTEIVEQGAYDISLLLEAFGHEPIELEEIQRNKLVGAYGVISGKAFEKEVSIGKKIAILHALLGEFDEIDMGLLLMDKKKSPELKTAIAYHITQD